MMYRLSEQGRENWASHVKRILYENGFGDRWEEQYVENGQGFICEFTERLGDIYTQTWNTAKSDMSKLTLYNMYKTEFRREIYLDLDIPRRLRRFLAKFRTSCHNLEIEIGRRHNIPKEERFCSLCGLENHKVEDEYHFLLECNAYANVRVLYLGDVNISLYYFRNILASNDKNELIRLANFICVAFDIRKQKMSALI
jgi:hypothetical protein